MSGVESSSVVQLLPTLVSSAARICPPSKAARWHFVCVSCHTGWIEEQTRLPVSGSRPHWLIVMAAEGWMWGRVRWEEDGRRGVDVREGDGRRGVDVREGDGRRAEGGGAVEGTGER